LERLPPLAQPLAPPLVEERPAWELVEEKPAPLPLVEEKRA